MSLFLNIWSGYIGTSCIQRVHEWPIMIADATHGQHENQGRAIEILYILDDSFVVVKRIAVIDPFITIFDARTGIQKRQLLNRRTQFPSHNVPLAM